MSCCDKDLLDERIDSPEDFEVEEPRAVVLVHIRWDQLPVLKHLLRIRFSPNRKNPKDCEIWELEKKREIERALAVINVLDIVIL